MVSKKLIALIVAAVGVIIADYASIYVPDEFENVTKYKFIVTAMKIMGFAVSFC
jgi:hypothetical protein